MEQEKTKTGSFVDFRAGMVEDYYLAKQRWIDATEATGDNSSIETLKANMALYDEFEALEAEIHEYECIHVEKQLSGALLPLGVKVYNEMLAHGRAWKEAELARLEEMRKQGISYKERMEKINVRRLKTVLVVDKGDITINDIEMIPVAQWLEPIVGYDRLKKLGVTEFVKRNFNFMFNIKR